MSIIFINWSIWLSKLFFSDTNHLKVFNSQAFFLFHNLRHFYLQKIQHLKGCLKCMDFFPDSNMWIFKKGYPDSENSAEKRHPAEVSLVSGRLLALKAVSWNNSNKRWCAPQVKLVRVRVGNLGPKSRPAFAQIWFNASAAEQATRLKLGFHKCALHNWNLVSAAPAHVISNYLLHNEARALCLTCKITMLHGEKSQRIFSGPQSRKITFSPQRLLLVCGCVSTPAFRIFLSPRPWWWEITRNVYYASM